MTGKVFGVVIGVVALLMLYIALPVIPQAVESFRTDVKTQNYNISTAVGSTNTSVALSNSLWNSDVSYVTGISSNTTGDSPVADNYTVASRSLSISGLAGNTTRLLSVDYRAAGLTSNPAADQASTFLPGIVVGLIILVPMVLVASLLAGNR